MYLFTRHNLSFKYMSLIFVLGAFVLLWLFYTLATNFKEQKQLSYVAGVSINESVSTQDPSRKAVEFKGNTGPDRDILFLYDSKKYDGYEVVVDNAKLEINGVHNFQSVTVRNNGVITSSKINHLGQVERPIPYKYEWSGYVKASSGGSIRPFMGVSYSNDMEGHRAKLTLNRANGGNICNIEIYNYVELSNSCKSRNDWNANTWYQYTLEFVAPMRMLEDYNHRWLYEVVFGLGNGPSRIQNPDRFNTEPNDSATNRTNAKIYSFSHLDANNQPQDLTLHKTELQTVVSRNLRGKFMSFYPHGASGASQINKWSFGDHPSPLTYLLQDASGQPRPRIQGGLELQIAGALNLESGGRIDVSAKGYPGGDARKVTDTGNEELGKGTAAHLDGGGNYGKEGQGYKDMASGGGLGGRGGQFGVQNKNFGVPRIDVLWYSDMNDGKLSHGSGGGGKYINLRGYRDKNGGRGGGKLKMVAENINISPTSQIASNGEIITYGRSSDGKWPHDAGYCNAVPGGGSGGMIWLQTDNLITGGAGASEADLNGGKNRIYRDPNTRAYVTERADSGLLIQADTANPKRYGLSARGGENTFTGCDGSGEYGNGGGGGIILIGPRVAQPSVSIQKSASPQIRYGSERATITLDLSIDPPMSGIKVVDSYNGQIVKSESVLNITPDGDHDASGKQITWDLAGPVGNVSLSFDVAINVPDENNKSAFCNQAINNNVQIINSAGDVVSASVNQLVYSCSLIDGKIYGKSTNIINSNTIIENGSLLVGNTITAPRVSDDDKIENTILDWTSFLKKTKSRIAQSVQYRKTLNNNDVATGNWWIGCDLTKMNTWYYNAPLTLSSPRTYQCSGTLITKGNLTIERSIKRSPITHNLGIIANEGDININVPDSPNHIEINAVLMSAKEDGVININVPEGRHVFISGALIADKVIVNGYGNVVIQYDRQLINKALPILSEAMQYVTQEQLP